MNNSIKNHRITGLVSMIGNTPLLEIRFSFKGEDRVIYAKAENLNMTGSIKDRMALHIVRQAYAKGALKPGDMIIEATSGNTGIAFAAIGHSLGHPVTIFMPNWMSVERINLIKSFGASIILVSKEEGGFLGSIQMAEDLAKKTEHSFLPRQFSNQDNMQAHVNTTGPEIWWQLQARNLKPDAFLAGVGTGGTIMGTGAFLREKHPSIKLFPMEPASSPTLSTGYKVGKHRIQGISDEFIPAIVNLKELDQVIAVDDGDGIIMAQKLACELGLGVGISSGANLVGAIMVQNMLGSTSTVVTVFSDDNKKYLSTDLFNQEPIKSDFISPHVELKEFRALKRVCYTCCDPVTCAEDYSLLANKALPSPPRCPRRD